VLLTYVMWPQGQMGYADCRQLFESALSLEPKWEKAHFQFAR
jgi:hypothetical protein